MNAHRMAKVEFEKIMQGRRDKAAQKPLEKALQGWLKVSLVSSTAISRCGTRTCLLEAGLLTGCEHVCVCTQIHFHPGVKKPQQMAIWTC